MEEEEEEEEGHPYHEQLPDQQEEDVTYDTAELPGHPGHPVHVRPEEIVYDLAEQEETIDQEQPVYDDVGYQEEEQEEDHIYDTTEDPEVINIHVSCLSIHPFIDHLIHPSIHLLGCKQWRRQKS